MPTQPTSLAPPTAGWPFICLLDASVPKPWRADWYIFAGSPVPVSARYTSLDAAYDASFQAVMDGAVSRFIITRIPSADGAR